MTAHDGIFRYRFPPYEAPHGIPAAWQDDVSGQLPKVVMAYFAHGSGSGVALTHDQLVLLRGYLAYFIAAPCWRDSENGEIAALRRQIALVRSEEEIDAWIEACLEIGIDPL